MARSPAPAQAVAWRRTLGRSSSCSCSCSALVVLLVRGTRTALSMYRHARRCSRLTRGPEASDTAASHQLCTHRTPGCAQLKRRKHSAARSTCAAASVLRCSPLGANTVCKSRNSFADALFTQGLMALMQPIICCMLRAQSAREFVTEFSGGATRDAAPKRGVAQS